MRFHPNQTKHQQAMRMSKFSIELLLGVSVKISHQQIGSISTLLFECLVFLFRSPNIQIAFFFFQTMTFAFGLSCYVSLNSGLPGLTHWICLGQFCWQWQWYLLVIPSSVTWQRVWRWSFLLPLLICQRPRRTARSMWTLISTSMTSSSHSFILHTSRKWPMSFHFS